MKSTESTPSTASTESTPETTPAGIAGGQGRSAQEVEATAWSAAGIGMFFVGFLAGYGIIALIQWIIRYLATQ